MAALMEFKDLSLKDGAAHVVEELVRRGNAGLVLLCLPQVKSQCLSIQQGMFRACATEDGLQGKK